MQNSSLRLKGAVIRNGYGAVVGAGWMLILLACGVATIPYFGFFAYILGIPLLVAAFVLSIVVMAKGGVFHGILLLLVTIIAPVFVILAPWITTAMLHEAVRTQPAPLPSPEIVKVEAPAVVPYVPVVHPLPKEVILTEAVTIPITINGKESGSVTVSAGTKVRVVSRDGDFLLVRHGDTVKKVPLGATNFRDE
ncbi:hypothetical protein BH09VER1_BH09VER1_51480 [soil metagenome]